MCDVISGQASTIQQSRAWRDSVEETEATVCGPSSPPSPPPLFPFSALALTTVQAPWGGSQWGLNPKLPLPSSHMLHRRSFSTSRLPKGLENNMGGGTWKDKRNLFSGRVHKGAWWEDLSCLDVGWTCRTTDEPWEHLDSGGENPSTQGGWAVLDTRKEGCLLGLNRYTAQEATGSLQS